MGKTRVAAGVWILVTMNAASRCRALGMRMWLPSPALAKEGSMPGSRREPFAIIEALAARAAGIILRYGVVVLLLYYGAFKFTEVEAQAIQPLVANSPGMAWLYRYFSVQAVSNLIGASELAFALAMAARSFAWRVCALGSLGASLTFVITLSFLVSTPGTWVSVPGFFLPVPNELGGFVLKDLLLLGASLWSLAEALSSARETTMG
jgi:reactive chlorine resistance protein C